MQGINNGWQLWWFEAVKVDRMRYYPGGGILDTSHLNLNLSPVQRNTTCHKAEYLSVGCTLHSLHSGLWLAVLASPAWAGLALCDQFSEELTTLWDASNPHSRNNYMKSERNITFLLNRVMNVMNGIYRVFIP